MHDQQPCCKSDLSPSVWSNKIRNLLVTDKKYGRCSIKLDICRIGLFRCCVRYCTTPKNVDLDNENIRYFTLTYVIHTSYNKRKCSIQKLQTSFFTFFHSSLFFFESTRSRTEIIEMTFSRAWSPSKSFSGHHYCSKSALSHKWPPVYIIRSSNGERT